jgi:hypothetical protein
MAKKIIHFRIICLAWTMGIQIHFGSSPYAEYCAVSTKRRVCLGSRLTQLGVVNVSIASGCCLVPNLAPRGCCVGQYRLFCKCIWTELFCTTARIGLLYTQVPRRAFTHSEIRQLLRGTRAGQPYATLQQTRPLSWRPVCCRSR